MKKLILNEDLFLEGKNLEKTFDQYKSKLVNFLKNDYPWDSEDALEGRAESSFNFVMQLDPTYQEGGTTTGDFGIWLLNQYIKGNLDSYGNYDQDIEGFVQAEPVENLLKDFIEKKSNLRNKDINSYKTPNDLYQALAEVQLSDRQKERKIRKDIKGARKIGSTEHFDIYIPDTYEASCALGKGSGWCTADSRTRQYYDEYKRRYGGEYYILVSKDGKYRYQIHFESDQYSAAGTNPDIGTPNEEVMLEYTELIDQWPELNDFFDNETDQIRDVSRFLIKFLSSTWGKSVFDFSVLFDDLASKCGIDTFYTQYLEEWMYPERIDYKRVANSLLDNPDLTMQIVDSFNNENKKYSNTLGTEDLKKLILTSFINSVNWETHSNLMNILTEDVFGSDDFIIKPSDLWPNEVDITLTIENIVDNFLYQYNIEDELENSNYNRKKTIDFLKNQLIAAGLYAVDSDELQTESISLCKIQIQQDAYDIPGLSKVFFDNEQACQVFFKEFNNQLNNLFSSRIDQKEEEK